MTPLPPADAAPTRAADSRWWLVAILALVAAAWALQVAGGRFLPSIDDCVRLAWCRIWRFEPFLATKSPYWPLGPFIVTGSLGNVHAFVDGWRVTLPTVLFYLGGLALLGWPTREARSPFSPWTAAVMASVPLTQRLTATVLSEGMYFLGLAATLRALDAFRRDPSPMRAALLAPGPLLLVWSRYEGWFYTAMLGAAALVIALHDERARIRTHLALLAVAFIVVSYPVFWLYLNERWQGDFLAPWTVAAGSTLPGDFATRVGWGVEWTLWAGPAAIIAGLAGAVLALRRRRWDELAVAGLLAFPFVSLIVNDKVGTIMPERFAFGVFVACALLGGEAIRAAVARLHESPRAATGLRALALGSVVAASFWVGVLDKPNKLQEIRIAGQQLYLEHPAKVILFDTVGYSSTLDDSVVYQAAWPYGGVIEDQYVLDRLPLSAEYLRELGAEWVLHKLPLDESRVQPPVVERRSLPYGWKAARLDLLAPNVQHDLARCSAFPDTRASPPPKCTVKPESARSCARRTSPAESR